MRYYIIEDVLIQIILNSSRIKPIVFLLDDVHWIDSSSLKLLQKITTIHHLKTLFILTARSEYQLNLNIPTSEKIVLKPLQDNDLVECVRDTLQNDLSLETKNLILNKGKLGNK